MFIGTVGTFYHSPALADLSWNLLNGKYWSVHCIVLKHQLINLDFTFMFSTVFLTFLRLNLIFQ
ncbi:hypothetical protein RhiirA4_407614 [Rhizophagus irregularis]|uniref:Uncharacterized protein n=1 Tax=Rhizophagus irregularis TaxID=588596 RepID=A0A2I1GYH2_9GLOM|nr:hypothetical protein RhiirA4_407614 [Rhizophagus irregularis]